MRPEVAFGRHIAQNRLSQPILAWKAADSGKLPFLVGDDGITKGDGLSGNQQVIGANWPASLLHLRTQPSVSRIGWCLERQDFKRTEHGFKLSGEPWRSFFRGPVTQFRGDDDAGADFRFANLADVLRHYSQRTADEIGDMLVSGK